MFSHNVPSFLFHLESCIRFTYVSPHGLCTHSRHALNLQHARMCCPTWPIVRQRQAGAREGFA